MSVIRSRNLFLWLSFLPLFMLMMTLMYSISVNCPFDGHSTREKTYTMSVNLIGRMGNNMFEYAALRGLASRTGHRPILPHSFSSMASLFHLKIPISQNSYDAHKFVHHYEHYGIPNANETIGNITELARANVLLMGFYESFRYFDNVKASIREEYRLKKALHDHAVDFFTKNLPANENITIVGLHVRMGDMDKLLGKDGWILPPLSYFHNAMEYFESRYRNVYFIVCSDDKKWLEKNLNTGEKDNVIISEETSGILEFAVLSSCDHMIISRGTYGWWAGWLVRGTTAYYKQYHPEGTFAAKNHPAWSFIPNDEHNHWVAIGA